MLPETYGADFLADAICHMLDECGVGLVNVLAGSYGSAIGYEIARRYPGRVGRGPGRHAEIRDADHMLILERTAETADLITRFLAGKPLDGLPYRRSIERVAPAVRLAPSPER
ncbi:hypothetical protein [Streptomyces sp. NPDC096323]|uniref:alpha/beta fold hydrolase n=1 Tax=Streptomyces sp. NPDC096323 TaxID=3155822 RepID=UPI0033182500